MAPTNLTVEKELWGRGYRTVAGIDEAGRGPLAGPVVAAAVALLPILNFELLKIQNLKLRDSKTLSEKQRERLYAQLTKNRSVVWGIGKVPEKTIDEINIYQATKLAMKKAVQNLQRKLKNRGNTINYLLVDGNMPIGSRIAQRCIIKGDATVLSCMAASIIAKVTRDRIMLTYHSLYPQYGFDRHKGYGTQLHLKTLRMYGPCALHRTSFAPVFSVMGP